MTFRLTLLARDGWVHSVIEGLDAETVRDTWNGRDDPLVKGLVSLDAEGDLPLPHKRAFFHDALLLTGPAFAAGAGFITNPMGGHFSGLHAFKSGPVRLSGTMRRVLGSAGPLSSDGVALLSDEIIRTLGDTEVAAITGHRLVRTALVHLDVRFGADLSGLTEGHLLSRLGGDRVRLKAFQDQAKACALRLEAKREHDASACASITELGFRRSPLKDRIRRSLAHLDPVASDILSRNIGLDAPPEEAGVLMEGYGITRERVTHLIRQSMVRIDRLDDWPRRLRQLIDEILPASRAEIERWPCFEGLGADQVVALARIGTKDKIHCIEARDGSVYGSLVAREWEFLKRSARDLVRKTGFDATPERFLQDLRSGLPGGVETYERFLLREIGWPEDPGKDWLLILKGRISVSSLIRQVADGIEEPLSVTELAEAVHAYSTVRSVAHVRRYIDRQAQQGPDGRWKARLPRDTEGNAKVSAGRACEGPMETRPRDAALPKTHRDADLVASAIKTSAETRSAKREYISSELQDAAPDPGCRA